MLAQERQAIILDLMKNKNFIKITEIVNRFEVSNETARRDLEALQDEKLVKRVYGGAVLTAQAAPVISKNTSYSEKAAIGRAAAALVKEGDKIMLDTGTTMLEIARNLKEMDNLTVLTNSLPIINELINTNVVVVALGGYLDPDEQCMYGSLTSSAMKHFFVDKSFIGAGGITLNGGVSDYNTEIDNRRIIFERSGQVILAADSGKFGINAFTYICPIEDINTIVSDNRLSADYMEGIRERRIELILADVEDTNP
jgi:DeoR/GlpR family transcriptional regulator of sugar metabolism